MPSRAPDLLPAITQLYSDLRDCYVSTLPYTFANDLFGDIAREGQPKNLAGVQATSSSEWAFRYAQALWDTIRAAGRIEHITLRNGGRLSATKAKLVEKKKHPVRKAIGHFPVPTRNQMDEIARNMEAECRRVNARWAERGRPEARDDHGMTRVLRVYDKLDVLFRSAITVLRTSRPTSKRARSGTPADKPNKPQSGPPGSPSPNLTAPVDSRQSLTEPEQRVLDLIKAQPSGRGITGKQIVTNLKKLAIELKESTLRRHVLPKLAKHFRVKNQRSRGGYYHDLPA